MKTRKTGVISRDHLWENRLTHIELKRKYIYLSHEKDIFPMRFKATAKDRSAWAAKDWDYFEKREDEVLGGEPYYA